MEVNGKHLTRSPEYRKPLLIFLLFQTLFIMAGLLSALVLLDFQTHLMDERFYAVLNQVVDDYPLAEEDVIRTITAPVDPRDISAGAARLTRYGYSDTVSFIMKPVFRPLFYRFLLQGGVVFIFIIGGTLVLYHKTRVPLLKKIDILSETTLSILKGADPQISVGPGEGLWSLLEHRHNQLVRKMQSGAEKLREEKLFLKQILSGISHQLKTPMASLIMYTDLMIQDPKISEEKRLEFLNHCSRSLERMEHLVKNLLKLARLEAGAIDFHRVPVNMLTMLEQLVREIHFRTGNRRITISQESGASPILDLDPLWTKEVFSNLLVNALNHTTDSGNIRITLQQTPLFLRVRITDDGTGIAAHDLPRVFERFFRRSTNGDSESAGIGLALCRTILSSQGADICAASPPGGGAEFTVTFPYKSVS